MKPALSKSIYIIACAGLSVLAYMLACFFVERMAYWYMLAGILDWPIFVDYAQQYINTGHLYEQSLQLYSPGAPVYKFPPLFISVLVFCFQHGISEDSLKFWISFLHIALYFLTPVIFILAVKRKVPFLLFPIVSLYLLSSDAFFDNFVRMQLEIYIVFLLCLAIIFLIRKQYFASGFFLGFSVGLKIYPIFFCLGLIIRRDYRSLVGVVAGFVTTIAISLTTISLDQHWHYFTNIVPFMLSESIYATVENVSIGYFAILLGFSGSHATIIAKSCMLFAILAVVSGTIMTDFCRPEPEKNNDLFDSLRIAGGFSVLISGFVVGSLNSWWNYQVLLMIPVMVVMTINVERRYFSWFSMLATFTAGLFIYCGSVEQLASMLTLSNTWLGDPNFAQPLFAHSVYLRSSASIMIFLATVWTYWRVLNVKTAPETR